MRSGLEELFLDKDFAEEEPEEDNLEDQRFCDSESLYLRNIRDIPIFSRHNKFGEDEEKEAGKRLIKARKNLLNLLLNFKIAESRECLKIRKVFEKEIQNSDDREKRYRRYRLSKVDDPWKFIAQFRHEYQRWPISKELRERFNSLSEEQIRLISKLRLADLREEAGLKMILEKNKSKNSSRDRLKNKFPRLNLQIFLRSIHETRDAESWQYWRVRIFEELSDIPFLPRQISGALSDLSSVENEFVSANLRLVFKPARKYAERFPESKFGFGDLIQEGNGGLYSATKRFSPEKGFRFSTFANWWIKQAIQRAVEMNLHTIRVPVHISEKYRKIQSASFALSRELERAPSLEEVSERLGGKLTPNQITNVKEAVADADSLDRVINLHGEDTASAIGEFVEDTKSKSPEKMVLERGLEMTIDNLLTKALSPREAEVINMRFGLNGNEEHTAEAVGAKLNVTRQRIHRIEKTALSKLSLPRHKVVLESFLNSR